MEAFNNILRSVSPYAFAAVFLLAYIAEHIIPQHKELLDHKHDIKNIIVGLLNLVFIALVGYQFQRIIEWFNKKNWGVMLWFDLPWQFELVLGFVLIDLFMYWWHRINHEWSFLWYFHKFHHQDKKLNTTSALRFHTFELLLSYVAKIITFSLLGISVSAILIHTALFFPIVLFHHANLKIPTNWDLFIRHFIVTPHMHRIHHSVIEAETNSNYSSVLPYWDKLFSSYKKQPLKEIEFGIYESV